MTTADLVRLNQRIARSALGNELNEAQETYLGFLSVCLGRFALSATDLNRMLVWSKPSHENELAVMHLNRDYLNYARLASMDARSGRFDRLVELGLTIELAEILLALTNEQITRIALYWPGLVVKIDTRVFECGNSLHTLAGRYHATAFLSATNSQKIQQTI